jgi:hypothetical protein
MRGFRRDEGGPFAPGLLLTQDPLALQEPPSILATFSRQTPSAFVMHQR